MLIDVAESPRIGIVDMRTGDLLGEVDLAAPTRINGPKDFIRLYQRAVSALLGDPDITDTAVRVFTWFAANVGYGNFLRVSKGTIIAGARVSRSTLSRVMPVLEAKNVIQRRGDDFYRLAPHYGLKGSADMGRNIVILAEAAAKRGSGAA